MPEAARTRLVTIALALAGAGSWKANVSGWGDTLSGAWEQLKSQPFGWFAVVLCAVVIVYVNWGWCREQIGWPKPAAVTPVRWADADAVMAEFREWLFRNGFKAGPDKTIEEGVEAKLEISSPTGQNFGIAMLKGQPKVFLLLLNIGLEKQHAPLRNSPEFVPALEEALIELTRMGALIGEVDSATMTSLLYNIPVQFDESFTELGLLRAIDALTRTQIIVEIILAKHLRLAVSGKAFVFDQPEGAATESTKTAIAPAELLPELTGAQTESEFRRNDEHEQGR
ncbi:MAG: hypothetical protein IT300_12420 [Dehalococcoidia bacterium]|nr:hypothetical protein [Dehalococcoidia bacterium]